MKVYSLNQSIIVGGKQQANGIQGALNVEASEFSKYQYPIEMLKR
jgi:hypothetical protein